MPWEDNNTGTGLFADPASGGIGYQNWSSAEEGSNSSVGFFNGPPYASTPNSNIITGLPSTPSGHSFGMYGEGTNNFARAYRSLRSPLMVGGTAVVRIGANYRNGAKGVKYLTNTDSPNQIKFLFQIAGDKFEYFTPTQGYVNVSGTFSYNPAGYGFHIDYRRITSTTGTVIVQQIGTGPGSALTVNLVSGDGNLSVDQIEFFCGGTNTTPDNENNFYFNFLSAYNAWR